MFQEDMEEVRQASDSIVSMPKLQDQWFSLDALDQYNVCLIEIFPPSVPYFNEELNKMACFQLYSEELNECGFKKFESYEFQNYIATLEKLITKIREINSDIKIVLVNGELITKNKSNFIGSKELNAIIEDLKNSTILYDKNIKFLNMIDLLECNNTMNYETGFPYLYLRRIRNSDEIVVSRDCKHATKELRLMFLQEMFNLVNELGYDLRIQIEEEKKRYKNLIAGATFSDRAKNFVEYSLSTNFAYLDLTNPRDFSTSVSYALETKDLLLIENIKTFIQNFSDKYLLEPSDLKSKFYYIRTIAAFVYDTKICLVEDLHKIFLKILSMSDYVSGELDNFALLWLDDLATILLASLSSCSDKNKQVAELFELLQNSRYVQDYRDLDKCILRYEKLQLFK
ncbi:MAG: hypothetical protein CO085_08915 [Sulfurimonas sp. CG_4_9_14_0_8_um_filter_36_384]|nr:MAG: hypothetical protein COS13_03510 [Sulfurimonas sp. CG01_land_8_20_14_3_00_36_23]PIW24843.1 MAG: hypothetical protein COW31_04005 [Sulfurimonas sp. CG15_BIG_FIL_POST_REV_8_21_14_020_36_339]PIW52325.1 MAG: hypothetical protein COW17_08445 [Sulfurimonas sp. CG12_big_fil_rev_8_21_14_0_65_36_1453]PIZ60775.1 MAG: hypothetical protein COY21_01755 [Sulfurimonas sp. CG_4_10_14_0_2_um_filter_36_1607]PJB85709.1 MAG: hypothetical protein CO085_08915 [Sulfurimonas sp. CG_4_9_14_0_8_um_filter_36_384]